jgi:hypothetical protein
MENSENTKSNAGSYLVPVGGAIGLFFFFAPWLGCSGQNMSGSDIAQRDQSLWLVLVGAIIIIITYFYSQSKNANSKASKIIIFVSSIVPVILMLAKYAKLQSDSFTRNAFEIKFGSILTILGFVLSFIGAIFITQNKQETAIPEKNIYCGNCGKEYSSSSAGSFCDECGNKI